MLSEIIEGTDRDVWDGATRHPFLRAVGQGQAPHFGVWLAQDALFVADLVVFQSRLVARAPRSAQPVIAAGVVGLIAELDWFEDQAEVLGVSLTVEPKAATRAYRALLHQLDSEPYGRAVVALWLLERIYLQAWRYAASCGPAGDFAAAVAHWTDPAFVRYVTALEVVASSAVAEVGGAVPDIVRSVMICETHFWDLGGGPA